LEGVISERFEKKEQAIETRGSKKEECGDEVKEENRVQSLNVNLESDQNLE